MQETIINHYIQAWNSTNRAERRALLEKSFASEGRYTDPHIPTPVQNLDEMDAIIATFRSRLPYQLVAIHPPEFHSYVFRFHWKMAHQEVVLSQGLFVGELNKQGKICNLICFIDQ